jgi:hypothetical protein
MFSLSALFDAILRALADLVTPMPRPAVQAIPVQRPARDAGR